MSKPEKLTAKWSKKECDIVYHYPRSPDGHLLHGALSSENLSFDKVTVYPSFLKELERRGYDVTTLKFEVSLRPDTRDRDRQRQIERTFEAHREGIGAEVSDVE